jgi:hypothetical protein
MSLQEAEYGITDLAMQGVQGRYVGDENLLVKFFTKPRFIQSKSNDAGRPIFEDTHYVQIMQPGNKDSIIIRPATSMDKNRFAEHYKKFLAREDQEAIEGTLLSEWMGVTRSQVEELKFLNIVTVEQLAAVTDSNAQNVMGISMLKTKAQAYLEKSKDEHTAQALGDANAKIRGACRGHRGRCSYRGRGGRSSTAQTQEAQRAPP